MYTLYVCLRMYKKGYMEIFFTIHITLNVFQLTGCYLLSVEQIMCIGEESYNFYMEL